MNRPSKYKITTEKQKVYLDYIIQYWLDNRFSPSIRDIADQFNISTSVVNYYLDYMADEGMILHREKGISRNIVPMLIAEIIVSDIQESRT